jgi:hypothetical protein
MRRSFSVHFCYEITPFRGMGGIQEKLRRMAPSTVAREESGIEVKGQPACRQAGTRLSRPRVVA